VSAELIPVCIKKESVYKVEVLDRIGTHSFLKKEKMPDSLVSTGIFPTLKNE